MCRLPGCCWLRVCPEADRNGRQARTRGRRLQSRALLAYDLGARPAFGPGLCSPGCGVAAIYRDSRRSFGLPAPSGRCVRACRRLVDGSMSDRKQAGLVGQALRSAYGQRRWLPGLLPHSDRAPPCSPAARQPTLTNIPPWQPRDPAQPRARPAGARAALRGVVRVLTPRRA